MSTNISLEDFDKEIRHLGEVYYRWVLSKIEGKAWIHATLEARYAKDGSYWSDKMRVETLEHEIISLGTADEIRISLVNLNRLRRAFGWFGFRLDLSNDGKVTITYDYSPDSADDPSFFED